MANLARRSAMLLFSSPSCWQSHRARLVLAEKGISAEIFDVDPHEPSEDLLELNPYNSVPTLVDRDLILYPAQVIMEYLDERFPHPPLLPPDPMNRGRFRLMLYRIENDWFSLLRQLDEGDAVQAEAARRALRDSLAASVDLFAAKPFFLSDEFSLVDCSLAPLLWRLPHYGIELPPQAQLVLDYAERLFRRPAFRHSLSAVERAMRP
ncbi:MAG TPA: glutathione S-transferase N-terminal domain-containing protein [Candidatus Competibacteraceae bacterium]|nr:glutathione S-transferase N-terminal domain-containing protein [Candidatus Competibacteraceae bacterium]